MASALASSRSISRVPGAVRSADCARTSARANASKPSSKNKTITKCLKCEGFLGVAQKFPAMRNTSRPLLPSTALFRPPQEKVDAALDFGMIIGGEIQLRDAPQVEAPRQFVTQKALRMFQTGHGGFHFPARTIATLTWAWRISDETSTKVTETELRRGSSISKPINSDSSSFTASDTRLDRCSSISQRHPTVLPASAIPDA